jgi:hypothetical protein
MTGGVGAVCATRNGRDVVALFLATFVRHHPGRRLLVADNDSTDGTLDLLASARFVDLVTSDERLLSNSGAARAYSLGHGPTLDWLLDRAAAAGHAWAVTLDSDIEFSEPVIGPLVEAAARAGVVAMGEDEPAWGPMAARLAPHVLAVHVPTWARISASFHAVETLADPTEAARWRARPPTIGFGPVEAAAYPTLRVFDVGATFRARLDELGLPWAATPAHLRRYYRHLCHGSWADLPDLAPGLPGFAEEADATRAYARARIHGIA